MAAGKLSAAGAPYSTLDDFVGNTPLVRLKRLPGRTSNVVLAKLEGNNPAGSVKDRPALSMIVHAEQRGEIKPGDTLIEATSGNTGISLAMIAAVRGYRCLLVMPEDMSMERRYLLKAYGAEIVLNPSATVAGLSEYLWKLEQPAHAVANGYFVGAINRVGKEPFGENDFYGSSYFVNPRGQVVGEAASDTEEELVVRDLDLDMIEEVRQQWAFYRDRRPDAYGDLVAP